MSSALVEPQELFEHLDDPDWAIIDCRFELASKPPNAGAGFAAAGTTLTASSSNTATCRATSPGRGP